MRWLVFASRTARVQATYLSHLVNFTRWEKRHLPAENEAPKIVVLGNESRGFVDSLEFLIKQNALRIEGELVEFHYFDNARKDEAREMLSNKAAQLVYVLPNSSFTPREINDSTESAVVFGEGREFVTEKGGDVSFVTARNRVKLVVSEKY
ncbi:MAG: YfiR/HmsC family protein, partial [Opitutae bacterium]